MWTEGRYYRYTYDITLIVPIFEVNLDLPYEKIIFSIYSNETKLEYRSE
jgi:hypothetical protein